MIAVSLWLVTATARQSERSIPGRESASHMVVLQSSRISDGSCSTMPGPE